MSRVSLGQRRQMNVRMPVDLITDIDRARGPISRDSWIERAARAALHPLATHQDPELRQKTHQHRYTDKVSTRFTGGKKMVTLKCDCGQETETDA